MKTLTKLNILVIFLALAAFSCQNEEGFLAELASAETKYYEMAFTVQVTDLDGFQIFNEEVFTSGLDKILQETGINEKRLNKIYLKEAEFSMESNDRYQDLSIMGFLELTIYTDALGEKKVAKLNPVPAEQSKVLLTPVELNILPYFEEGKFIMTAQGFLEERIYENVEMLARFKFEVKAGI
ncbi:MAG: hypothetical protein V3V53_16575 [Bacteroidales bacterium]